MTEWSRRKSILLLIGAVIFVVVGIMAFLTGDTAHDRLTGAAIVPLFGSGILLCIMRLWQAIARDVMKEPDSADATIELGRSVGEKIAFVFIFWLIAAGCYLLIQSQPDSERTRFFAWVGVAFGIAAPFLLFLRPVRLVLSPAGLDYSLFKVGPIAWSDIVDVRVKRSFRIYVVVLEVANKEKYFARGFPLHLRLFYFSSSPFRIATSQLGVPARRILEAIVIRLAAPPQTSSRAAASEPTESTSVGFGRRKTPV